MFLVLVDDTVEQIGFFFLSFFLFGSLHCILSLSREECHEKFGAGVDEMLGS